MEYSPELVRFAQQVAQTFKDLLSTSTINPTALTAALEHCFHLPVDLSTEKRAEWILDEFFDQLSVLNQGGRSFQLAEFLTFFNLSEEDRKRLLGSLLYGLYYGDIDLNVYRLGPFYFMLQIVAENVSSTTLREGIGRLSVTETINLIVMSHRFHREGGLIILRYLEETSNKTLQTFLQGLRRHYFDFSTLHTLDQPLSNIVDQLEQEAQKTVLAIYTLLPQVVKSILKIPSQVNMQERFAPYLAHTYTREHVESFARFFGVGGVVSGLAKMLEIFGNPSLVLPKDLDRFINYVLDFVMHLEAFCFRQDKIEKGFQMITSVIPTAHKDLAVQPAVPSLLRAMAYKHPIYVLDQSSEPLFDNNRQALKDMAGDSIVHVSSKEALELAKRLGIEKLIDTTGTGAFGYGGARNAVFLLSPMFKHAHLNEKDLKKAFKQDVLSSDATTLFMANDDVDIPESNLFCYALYVYERRGQYIGTFGTFVGRNTKKINVPHLKIILEYAVELFPNWTNKPAEAFMSEEITKPRFCFNLPFPNEEGHFRSGFEPIPLLKPVIHCSGPRFPQGRIPTRHFIGLEEYLAKFIPYTFMMYLVDSLLDPRGNRRTTMPWNTIRENFTNLGEVFAYITEEKTRQAMQTAFWDNVKGLFEGEQSVVGVYLERIIQMEVDGIIDGYAGAIDLSEEESTSLNDIRKVFKFFQQDAALFRKFGLAALKLGADKARDLTEKEGGLSFADYPFTSAFYKVMRSVGEGEFNDIIASIVKEG